jgi:cell division protein ZapA (FtsZ GTPase activity inhibitor)
LKQSVTVKVAGHSLNLRTEEDPAYVRGLARQLSDRIDQIRQVSGTASAHQVALLTGLQLIDELAKAQRAASSIDASVRTSVERVLTLLEESESA